MSMLVQRIVDISQTLLDQGEQPAKAGKDWSYWKQKNRDSGNALEASRNEKWRGSGLNWWEIPGEHYGSNRDYIEKRRSHGL